MLETQTVSVTRLLRVLSQQTKRGKLLWKVNGEDQLCVKLPNFYFALLREAHTIRLVVYHEPGRVWCISVDSRNLPSREKKLTALWYLAQESAKASATSIAEIIKALGA